MWKSYKVFMRKRDRILFYLIFPLLCMILYAILLIKLAPGLKSGELINFFDVNSKRTEMKMFVILLSILPCVPFFITDECSLGELFWKKKENMDFLRRSRKGKEVFIDAVKMDYVLRFATLALIFGGAAIVEILIGAWHGYEFRSWSVRGIFFLLETVTCFMVTTLVNTLGRLISNGILRGALIYFGMAVVVGVMTVEAGLYLWLIPVMVILSLLLLGINVHLAKRRWEEDARDDQGD